MCRSVRLKLLLRSSIVVLSVCIVLIPTCGAALGTMISIGTLCCDVVSVMFRVRPLVDV